MRTIRLFEPTREGWTFGFNPLPSRGLDHARVEYAVDAVVNTLASVWGGEDTTKTPRLRRCLKLTLYALAANDLTLAEAGIFTATADPDGLRKRLTETLGDPFIAGSQTTGGSQAHGRNWSQGHSEGESETLRPIIERAYNQTYSLDEQVFEQTKELQTQQTGEALLRRPTGELVRLRIPHVDDRSTALTRVKRQIETFNERSLEAGTFSVPQVVVEREIAEGGDRPAYRNSVEWADGAGRLVSNQAARMRRCQSLEPKPFPRNLPYRLRRPSATFRSSATSGATGCCAHGRTSCRSLAARPTSCVGCRN